MIASKPPLLRGRDIKRYSYEFADKYLIATFPSKNYNIDNFPVVKNFLKGFYPKLKQTGEKLTQHEIKEVLNHAKQHGININVNSLEKSRKKTTNKWFETQDSISYWEDFYKQKITYIEIMTDNPSYDYDFPCFTFDTESCVVLNTAYIMSGNPNELKHILGILNSNLGRLLVKNYVVQLQQRQFRMLNQYVINFPIPRPEKSNVIKKLVDEVLKLKEQNKNTFTIEQKINDVVYEIFNFNDEEIKFIKAQ